MATPMSILWRGDCAECGQCGKLGYTTSGKGEGGPAFACAACHDKMTISPSSADM